MRKERTHEEAVVSRGSLSGGPPRKGVGGESLPSRIARGSLGEWMRAPSFPVAFAFLLSPSRNLLGQITGEVPEGERSDPPLAFIGDGDRAGNAGGEEE
jgi:hypothetical protein